jgi:hypothetical protein
MRAPLVTRREEIVADVCRLLQPDPRHQPKLLPIVRREIDGLVELNARFAPLLGANQVAKEAEGLVKATARLRGAYRKLAENPLLARPLPGQPSLVDRPSFFSFAEADPLLERTQLVLATVPKLTEEIALDRPPGVELRFAADVLEGAELVLGWLAECCGPDGHTAFTKIICATGALRLVEHGLDPDRDHEITKLLFEAVTETYDGGEFAFERALTHARNAKIKNR